MRKAVTAALLYIVCEVHMYLFINIDGNSDLGLYRFFEEHLNSNLRLSAEFIIMSLLLLLIVLAVSKMIDGIGKKINDKYCNLLFLLSALIIVLGGGFFAYNKTTEIISEQAKILSLRSTLDKEKTVIHAAGYVQVDGVEYDYTNTYDALVNCYDAGNRVVEIDFKFTSDGKLVCAHEGTDNSWAEGIDSEGPIREEEFLNRKFKGALTTMGLTQLSDYMRSHEDLYIVTDCKARDNLQSCTYIASNCPDILDRFIVQIYHAKDYDAIKKLGFKNIILTLYKTKEYERTPEALLKDIRDYDLIGITFWEEWMKEDFFEPLYDDGHVLLLVHTVNDTDDMQRDMDSGCLVYTDNIDNDRFR